MRRRFKLKCHFQSFLLKYLYFEQHFKINNVTIPGAYIAFNNFFLHSTFKRGEYFVLKMFHAAQKDLITMKKQPFKGLKFKNF